MPASTSQGSATSRPHWMDVLLNDENLLPSQASPAETVSQAVSEYPASDLAITAVDSVGETENNDVPMADVTNAAHYPAEGYPGKESLSDNVSETIVVQPAQSPSLPQIFEKTPKDEDQSSQAFSQSNTQRNKETTLPLNDDMVTIKDLIYRATVMFYRLSDNNRSLLLEACPNLRIEVGNLSAAMNSFNPRSPAFGSHPQIPSDTSVAVTGKDEEVEDDDSETEIEEGEVRADGDENYSPSETKHDSTTRSPSKRKSNKSNVLQVSGHARPWRSQNSNSEMLETRATLRYEEFQKFCNPGSGLDPASDTDTLPAFTFCKEIMQSDFSTKLLKRACEISPKTKNIAVQATSQGHDDRVKAMKSLMDRIYEYEANGSGISFYIKVWDKTSLAELTEPDWKNRPSPKSDGPGKYERWAYDIWTKDWIRQARKNKWPKVDSVVAESWAERLYHGRYWQQWCCFLSGGSGIHQRGALLLLWTLGFEPENKLSEPAFELVKTFILKELPWVFELVETLNPWALRIYQNGLKEEKIEELEECLRGYPRDALKGGLQGTQSEAFGKS